MKKCLNNLFNEDYFFLQVKRHRWLALVPLGIFAVLVFLCLVLDIDVEILNLLFLPYAIAIVPASAVTVFKNYGEKNDMSALLALPMQRKAIFISNYLAGLMLAIVPLTIICATISPHGYVGNTIIAFQALAVFYYTIACLGCLLGSHLWMQLMMMAVIAFGPVLVYVLINACIKSIAFGEIATTVLDSSMIPRLTPIFSAGNFVYGHSWDYAGLHIFITISLFSLALYINQRRPAELAEEMTLYKNANRFFLQPLLFLNIVYLTFLVCSEVVFTGLYFNRDFYLKAIILLVGTSLIVAILMQIWFSPQSSKNTFLSYLSKAGTMSILACAMLLIPLYQREKARDDYHIPEGEFMITLQTPSYGVMIDEVYGIAANQKMLDEILGFIDEHRAQFIKGSWNTGNQQFHLSIQFRDLDNSWSSYQYYFSADDFILSDFPYFEEIMLQERDTIIQNQKEANYQYDSEGNIYQYDDILATIQTTFKDQSSSHYLNQLSIEEDDLYNMSNWSYRLYLLSFSDLPYEEWHQMIFEKSPMILESEVWQEIQEVTDCFLTDHDGEKIIWTDQSQHEIFEKLMVNNVDLWLMEDLSVNEQKISMVVPIEAYVLEDMFLQEDGKELQLFENSELTLNYRMTFIQEEQGMILEVGSLEGVAY